MAKICDHTSVGMLVWKEDKLLLIERMKFPPGFAVPAGHVDADSTYEDAAKRELREEVGLEAENLELVLEEKMDNPYRREGGTWHNWKVYRVNTNGEINRSKDETKQAGWYTKAQIKELTDRTMKYLQNEITTEEFTQKPGLEPVMYELFKKMNIL